MEHSPGFLKLVNESKTRVKACDIGDVKRRLDARENFALVDVREESEFAAGHLPGAIHLSRGIIERDIERVLPDGHTPIVLYCGGGYRSVLVADSIQKMGYRNVVSMDGGWRAWLEAGYETEEG
jgi:rhodanese-related sulfurtransferase